MGGAKRSQEHKAIDAIAKPRNKPPLVGDRIGVNRFVVN